MKKFVTRLLICIILTSFLSENVLAFSFLKKEKKEKTQVEQDFGNVELNIDDDEKLKIEKNPPPQKIEEYQLSKTDEETIEAFKIQKKQDIEDITNLWQATVERNNVIKFALRKVTMNPEERKKHSSIMARSISALINGATLLPYVFGMNATIASAVAAGTSLGTQVAKNKLGYGQGSIPITDTELIQLASLIEDLQNNLIKNYYEYKSSIELLKDCRSKLAVYEKNYQKALTQKDDASILVTKSLYEKQQLEELKLKNQIKTARLELERFAGEDVVNNLNLASATEAQSVNIQKGELK